jgi:hypothetical protein
MTRFPGRSLGGPDNDRRGSRKALGASSTALRPRGKAFLVAAINRNYLSRSAPHQLRTALT